MLKTAPLDRGRLLTTTGSAKQGKQPFTTAATNDFLASWQTTAGGERDNLRLKRIVYVDPGRGLVSECWSEAGLKALWRAPARLTCSSLSSFF